MIVTVPDIRTLERRGHGLRGIAQFRTRLDNVWTDLKVESGTVTINDMDSMPGRTCQVRAFIDPGILHQDKLSVFGSWLRLYQEIVPPEGGTVRVPCGVFRVDKLSVEPLVGAVTIEGSDAGSMVVDYGLVTLGQGEVAVGASLRAAVMTMLTDAMGSITPWWTTMFNVDGLGDTVVATTRLQYEDSRAEAALSLLAILQRRLTMGIDGSHVFRFRPPPTPATPPDVVVQPGATGNLVSVASVMDRGGVANVATVSYTENDVQYRIYREYTGNPLIAPGGPYARTSVQANAPNAATLADAIAAADAALTKSTQIVRDFTVECSPIYGIEAGDVVTVIGRNGLSANAVVVGGTQSITATDGWTLRLRSFTPGPDIEEALG